MILNHTADRLIGIKKLYFIAVLLMVTILFTGCLPKRNIRGYYAPYSRQKATIQVKEPIRAKETTLLNGTVEREQTFKSQDRIEKNDFLIVKEDEVVGRLAVVRLGKGDTLPDIARHFNLGINTVSAANPGVDIWVPEAGNDLLLPLSFVLPDAHRKGIIINLAAMRLYHFKKDGSRRVVSTYPVGVGTAERPTPMGNMYIARKKVRPTWYVPASIAADYRQKGDPLPSEVPPGPLNPLGEYALYLNKSGYLVHGTNKPSSIGLRATSGCIRLYPEDIERLFADASVKSPVLIVNQPYLVGRRDGIVYLEVHKPFEPLDTTKLDRMYAKLSRIETKWGHPLDWRKVAKVVDEAPGYPVPIYDTRKGSTLNALNAVRIKHPGRLYGKPQVPEYKIDAWYVLAANLPDKNEALRLAAIINHQGPQIPARVLTSDHRHRVIAGPFSNMMMARNAVKRLRIDLDLDGILVEP